MPLRFFDKISRKTTALLMFGIFLFSSAQAAELSDIQKQIKLQEEKIAAQKQEQISCNPTCVIKKCKSATP